MSHTTRSRRSVRQLACVAAAVIASGAIAGIAQAAPGNPGVPSAPTVLMHETFELGQVAGGLTELADYVSPTGPYTAAPEWLDATQGNGLIVDGTTSGATFNAAGFSSPSGEEALRDLATKLGELNGTSPNSANHAVTAWTSSADPGANKVEFETVNPIDLNADGRFLTVAANVAVVSCHSAHPQLIFYLDDEGDETQVNPAPLDPCGGNDPDAVYATELIGGRAALFTGDNVRLIIRNAQGSGSGNDHAFDDVRVLDVTPQLDKVFVEQGSKLKAGTVTNLVLTVTNTSELGEKTGWSFIDTLPSGLTVAGEVTHDCDAATIAGAVGSGTIVVSDGSLANGSTHCTITAPVTSSKGGVFENSAHNISSQGLDAPGSTFIEFLSPPGAPDTGEQRVAMWPSYLAVAAGLALLAGLAGTVAVRRRD